MRQGNTLFYKTVLAFCVFLGELACAELIPQFVCTVAGSVQGTHEAVFDIVLLH